MAHFKRRKTRRNVRCTLCTPHRWRGNGKGRHKERVEATIRAARTEASAVSAGGFPAGR